MPNDMKPEEGTPTHIPDELTLDVWLPFPRAAGAAKQQDGVREEPSSLRMIRSLTPAIEPIGDLPGVIEGIIDTAASLVCKEVSSHLPRHRRE
jgi:hypothetical protein